MNARTRRLAAVSLVAVTATAVLAGCGGADGGSDAEGGVLKLWTHNAGNAAEYDVVEKVVNDFNASQTTYKVEIEAFPQGSYNDAVVASSSSKKLPCILDVDGPNVPNWAWGGYLAPLELAGGEVPVEDQLPSTVGKYQDKVYAFGFYDVALTMFARKSVLDEHGIRVPTWTSRGPVRSSPRRWPTSRRAASSSTRWRWAPEAAASGGPTRTRRSCRASAETWSTALRTRPRKAR